MSRYKTEYNPFSENSSILSPNIGTNTFNYRRATSSFNPFESVTQDPNQTQLNNNTDNEDVSKPKFVPASVANKTVVNTGPHRDTLNDLDRRESALKQYNQDSHVPYKSQVSSQPLCDDDPENASENNFPPLPKCCCCQPCFHNDISMAIMQPHQSTVRFGFAIWVFYFCVLALNVIGCLVYMVTVLGIKGQSHKTHQPYITFATSILLLILVGPLNYVFCFRPLYNGFRTFSSFNFVLFFICFGFHMITVFLLVLGIDVFGSCGWVNSLKLLSVNIGVSIFMMVVGVGFTMVFFMSVFFYFKVYRIYRTIGGSIGHVSSDDKSIKGALS